MRIGAHVKSSGSPRLVFDRALAMGAEAIQMFISAPQQWKPPAWKDEDVEAFRGAYAEHPEIPVFMHGVYLVNLATDDQVLLNRSAGSLKQYSKWGASLGVQGTIFHVGSHKGAGFDARVEQICRTILEVLEYADNESLLIMENNAGQGGGVGCRFDELGAIIRGCGGHPRLRVCIDTCHAFAMGYDLATKEGCEIAMVEFDREIGVDRLAAVHANDSKTPLGGVRDKHENIGDGYIGYDGFRTIMSHPAFRDVPFLLEVPGVAGEGPDEENIERLKRLRAEAGLLAPG
ncbi:MAG TPA: deoxyribonuclease IV [Tepidiformaceae bacterium]|nr:deoxyribonuclease IV [Tepidiformaceae bacterium]